MTEASRQRTAEKLSPGIIHQLEEVFAIESE